jgi:hypothetical protein
MQRVKGNSIANKKERKDGRAIGDRNEDGAEHCAQPVK